MVGWWFDFLYGILFYLKDIEGSFLIFWIELTNEPKPVQKINSITKLQNIIPRHNNDVKPYPRPNAASPLIPTQPPPLRPTPRQHLPIRQRPPLIHLTHPKPELILQTIAYPPG